MVQLHQHIGEDFIALASGTAAIRSGTTEGTIAIPIIDDNIDEGRRDIHSYVK